MNLPSVFLGCFVIGFLLSALSFAFSAIDAHVHFGPAHSGHMHGLGPINFATLTAFVAWFGGAGYLLTTQFRWLTIPAPSACSDARSLQRRTVAMPRS